MMHRNRQRSTQETRTNLVNRVLSASYRISIRDARMRRCASNRAIAPLLAGVDPALLQPPINVLRLSLHPAGLAPRIANLSAWRAHLLARLRHQIELSADPILVELLAELSGYSMPSGARTRPPGDNSIVVPLQLMSQGGLLSFVSTTTMFGTPIDITLSELALESFFPADAATAAALRRFAEGQT